MSICLSICLFVFVYCVELEVGSGGQFSPSVWPHNLATGFRPPSATVVSAEPFSHGTGTLRCLQKEMATYRHWSVSLWQDPDDVPHCRILSPDKTECRLISATLCGWRCCFVADQLWFTTCIREEEDCIEMTKHFLLASDIPPFLFYHTIISIMALVRQRPPNRDVKCRRGMKNLQFSTNISLYFRNDTRWGLSYYERQ